MGRVYLDRYEVDREIGRGGMAVVYRGIDLTLNRPVAVKVMHSHLLKRLDARERFCREARVIAKLKHENIVEVYDYSGSAADPESQLPEDALIVTELVEGISLAEYLISYGPMLPEVAAMVTAVVARALDHAHANGVVHRDVKPENIMIGVGGVLKLMDFGIAHVIDMEHLTVTGAIVGSPAHMSPEQVDGRALDARTDIFSLGTLFFLLASGTFPFSSDTPSGLLKSISEARVPDVRARVRGFPDDLHVILMKMMARESARRYQSASELADALESVLTSVGFGPVRAEMKQYFASPSTQAPLVRRRVAVGRVRLGQKYLSSGRKAKAIREADTALIIDPSCDEAAKFMDVVRRSIRAGKIAKIAVATLAVTVMAALAAWQVARIRDAASPDSLPAWEGGASIPGRPMSFEPPRRRGMDDIQTPRDQIERNGRQGNLTVAADRGPDEQADGIPEQDAVRRFPVSIHVYPPAVRIRLDGRQVGVGRVESLMVEPGRHEIVLSHPSCDQCRDVTTELNVDPVHPPKAPLRLSIAYREARLMVSGPPGGKVFINNESSPRGSTNNPILVPMDRPTPVEAAIRVVIDGRPDYSGTVTLQAGKASSIRLGTQL